MGHPCCSNPPELDPNSGVGHVEKLGGLESYVTGSLDSKRAVILITDVCGFDAPNVRELADEVAEAGYYALVPDFYHGNPYFPHNLHLPLLEWQKNYTPEKGFEEAKPLIQALKSKGIKSIGVVGFCWGGKVAVQLAKTEFVQAAVLLHPSHATVEDIKAVDVPIAILGAEIDPITPPDHIKEFAEILKGKTEIDSYVTIFPKVVHGFSLRFKVEDEYEVKCAKEAQRKMLEFVIKHVK